VDRRTIVFSRVEGSTGNMGRMRVRRLESMTPLSDSWTDGRDEARFAACDVEAD
jgi:hypothetical protein